MSNHPAKPLFDHLAKLAADQHPVPTWDQFAAANTTTRRAIVSIWHAHQHRHVEAMLNLMKFVSINGPLDGFDVMPAHVPVAVDLPTIEAPPLAPELAKAKVEP